MGSPVARELESVKVPVEELLLAQVLTMVVAHAVVSDIVLIVALLLAAAEEVLEAPRHDSVVGRGYRTIALHERVLMEVTQDEAAEVGCEPTV